MKKILLSALFCGFILNNGYCFDEEHKITNEYLDKAFGNLKETVDTLNESHMVIEKINMRNETYKLNLLNSISKVISNTEDQIRDNLKRFLEEFLKTVIPSGEDKGKIVGELLREHKLNNGHVKTICDDSVGFFMINNDDDNIIFFKICGGAMVKVNLYSYREKEKFTALLMLCVSKRYEVEFDIKSLLTSF